MKFIKKPIPIEAVQWTGENIAEIFKFTGEGQIETDFLSNELRINTLEGQMTATVGSWIIKGIAGEFYSCKPEIFANSYDCVEE